LLVDCEPISFACPKEIGERKGHPTVTPYGFPALLVSSGAVHKGHPAPMDRTDVHVGPLTGLSASNCDARCNTRGKSWSVILFEYFLLDKQEKVLRGLSKKVMGLQPN